MHQPRDLLGQSSLAVARAGIRRPSCVERFNLLVRKLGEEPEALARVGILDVDPVLIELIRASPRGREPDGATFGLAHLAAVALGQQRPGYTIKLHAAESPGQVDPRR